MKSCTTTSLSLSLSLSLPLSPYHNTLSCGRHALRLKDRDSMSEALTDSETHAK